MLDNLVERYAEFLRSSCPDNLAAYERRLVDDPEAARAEAAVYGYLHSLAPDVLPAETPSGGGADFTATIAGCQVLAEVTHLQSEAVTAASGLPNEVRESGTFRYIAEEIFGAIQAKVPQLADHPGPRIVFVVSEHAYAGMLFGTEAVKQAMVSGIRLTVFINRPDDRVEATPTHPKAPFFDFPGDGTVRRARRPVSAAILVALDSLGMFLSGMIHPDPAVSMDPGMFPGVPFRRCVDWPVVDGTLTCEWVNGYPSPYRIDHVVPD